jgi:prolyl-tRNA editing enzyme YbaK/EbsC (Cys-tRNA(Pro) deacylase)
MTQPPAASLALEELGISHRVFYHQGEVASLEQAARERGQRPEQVVRSLLFRLSAGAYVLVLVAGPVQIPWKALRAHLGQSRLTMASEDEVLAVTGYRVGTVSPFGLASPVRILLDSSVLAEPEISLGSGLPNTGILMSSADLQAALVNADVVNLTPAP